MNDLKDGCRATPAIADGKIYVRTFSARVLFRATCFFVNSAGQLTTAMKG